MKKINLDNFFVKSNKVMPENSPKKGLRADNENIFGSDTKTRQNQGEKKAIPLIAILTENEEIMDELNKARGLRREEPAIASNDVKKAEKTKEAEKTEEAEEGEKPEDAFGYDPQHGGWGHLITAPDTEYENNGFESEENHIRPSLIRDAVLQTDNALVEERKQQLDANQLAAFENFEAAVNGSVETNNLEEAIGAMMSDMEAGEFHSLLEAFDTIYNEQGGSAMLICDIFADMSLYGEDALISAFDKISSQVNEDDIQNILNYYRNETDGMIDNILEQILRGQAEPAAAVEALNKINNGDNPSAEAEEPKEENIQEGM